MIGQLKNYIGNRHSGETMWVRASGFKKKIDFNHFYPFLHVKIQ